MRHGPANTARPVKVATESRSKQNAISSFRIRKIQTHLLPSVKQAGFISVAYSSQDGESLSPRLTHRKLICDDRRAQPTLHLAPLSVVAAVAKNRVDGRRRRNTFLVRAGGSTERDGEGPSVTNSTAAGATPAPGHAPAGASGTENGAPPTAREVGGEEQGEGAAPTAGAAPQQAAGYNTAHEQMRSSNRYL